jgi:hypothetical protein
MVKVNRPIIVEFVLRVQLLTSLKLINYYGKLEEVIELQYHCKLNKVFLFKFYWHDITNKGLIVEKSKFSHNLTSISRLI